MHTRPRISCRSRKGLQSGVQRFVKTMTWSQPVREWLRTQKKRLRLRRLGTPEERFTHFYKANRWGNEESRSGPGSTLEYTRDLRTDLQKLFGILGVKSILDAPCGDYNWFRFVDRDADVRYIGGDIVAPLVHENQRRFANDNTTFVHLDITEDVLPNADVWLCRDCLFHLCEADIFRAIRRFLDSEIRYFLASTHTQCGDNRDIPTGACRLLDLEAPPYSFPKARLYLGDWIDGFPVRYLGLWDHATLVAALAAQDRWRRASPR